MSVKGCYGSEGSNLEKINAGMKKTTWGLTLFNLFTLFSSVLDHLSLFDLFVLEQSLKCDMCMGYNDCWRNWRNTLGGMPQETDSTSQEPQQIDEEEKRACEGSWHSQLPVVIRVFAYPCHVYTGACTRKPIKQMVAKAFVHPQTEGK